MTIIHIYMKTRTTLSALTEKESNRCCYGIHGAEMLGITDKRARQGNGIISDKFEYMVKLPRPFRLHCCILT